MLNRPNSENKKSSEPFAVHNLSRNQLKQIARETRDMKPLYNCGTFVSLKKNIKKTIILYQNIHYVGWNKF